MITAIPYAYFPLAAGTKLPAIKAWQKTQPGAYQAAGNYGIALQADDLILDADPRNYPIGRNILEEILEAHKFLQTFVVKTPRGGYHVYTKKDPNLKVKKQQTKFPGIDFLSEGHYVVGPGSSTLASKDSAEGTYQALSQNAVQPCPASLLTILEAPVDPSTQTAGEPTLLLESTFKGLCANALPAERGSRGITSYKMACQARDYGLPMEVAYQHMRDEWLPRWTEQFTEQELLTQCEHAYQYAQNSLGSKNPENRLTDEHIPPPPAAGNVVSIDSFQEQKLSEGSQPETLRIDKRGNPIECLANVAYILKHDAAFKGLFRFNEFASSLELTARPPWRKNQMNEGFGFTKRDLHNLQVWFSNKMYWEVPEVKVIAALEAVALPVHPVKEYLESVQWDGVPRLDRLFVDTMGAEDTPFIRDAGRVLGLACVKRIYEPGCKQDYVWVYEGAQGLRKSMWIAAWGGEWSSTGQLVRGDKDTYQNLRGKWIVELPEINATFGKQDDAWVKGIVSTPTDTYRASYERTARSVPRESVFQATINPSANREYLRDDENRRWLPIMCNRIDIEKLEKLRDQYFAEAVHRYKMGEKAYITDTQILAQAKAEQEKRREKDPWLEILADWANSREDGFTPAEIYGYLGFNAGQINSNHRKRVSAVLKQLGFIHLPKVGTGGRWAKQIDWSKV